MFEKVLIANRGEIACRIIDTARRLGVRTVAVYSDADRNALHVESADEAVHIGAAPARESYLDTGKVIEAARRTGARAIHPGYGFLSENAGFARACEQAGLVFIGPPADAIDAMGSKSRAKELMVAAKVPVVPGYHGADQSLETFAREVEAMGYPVLLKAVAGGGGKGMRRVNSADELADGVAAAKREGSASFGDDRLLVEKLLVRARHVEIQVFCDNRGSGVYLFERDCSAQRRHQKIIEEAPAPGLTDDQRRAMGEAAVRAARAIDYRGAGTVEFLFDGETGGFYFMEMNTRLQVEHPVTEMITGEDLVEWQLRIAAGEPLPRDQASLVPQGHAFEARIYAEDPDNEFLPATGTLRHLSFPASSQHVRIDTGVRQGDEVSPYYDPMIAKLVVHDLDRNAALRRLRLALSEVRIAGLASNVPFLYNLAANEDFVAGEIDTGFVEQHLEQLVRRDAGHSRRDLALAGLYLALRVADDTPVQDGDPWSPWGLGDAWRVADRHRYRFDLHWHGQPLAMTVERRRSGEGFRVLWDEQEVELSGWFDGEHLHATLDGHRLRALVADEGTDVALFTPDGAVHFSRASLSWDSADDVHGGFTAPINGTVVALAVAPGQKVAAGAPLLVMEAMKMEHTLKAPAAGQVESFQVDAGDLVSAGQELFIFVPDEVSHDTS